MYFGLFDHFFYIYFFLFLVSVFFSWFLPGWLITANLRIKSELTKALLAIPVGLVLWGIQGYLFGYIELRALTYVYIIAVTIISILKRKRLTQSIKAVFQELALFPKSVLVGILICTVIQILPHIGSGLRDSGGIQFYFVNAIDGVMHLSYIQFLKDQFPPLEPGAVGEQLVNYHYWSDLVTADLSRIWQLPVIHLFFQFIPFVVSFFTTFLLVMLAYHLKGTKKEAFLLLFFLTFGSDAAYIFTLLLHSSWGMQVPSIDSGLSTYFNIPQTFARLIFIGALFLLLEWWKKKDIKSGFLAIILIATLFGFKVYYGMYAVLGFCLVSLAQIIKSLSTEKTIFSFHTWIKVIKNYLPTIGLILLLALLVAGIYLPPNKDAGGLFYSPLEWPKQFLGAANINFNEWWLRMQVYEEAHNYRNIAILNLMAIVITLLSVYGTRLLGVTPIFSAYKKFPKELIIFALPVNIVFIFLALFTLQESGGFNTFNFFIVPIVSLNLFAAFNIGSTHKKWFVFISCLVVLLTLPRSIFQLYNYSSRYAAHDTDFYLTNDELDALEYLRTSTPKDAVIQTVLDNKHDSATPYTAFFSQRYTYITGVSMLEGHNQPTKERLAQLTTALENSDKTLNSVQQLGIDYLYILNDSPNSFAQYTPVFKNNSVTIIKTE